MGYRGCDFNISIGKEHCPGCGFPTSLWGRLLVRLRIRTRGRSLRPAETEVPKMTPDQRAAIEKGEDQISRKAQRHCSA